MGKATNNQLRIIGGEWRGRKLDFPNVDDLRPTADRVRETLFNWLQMQIPGARCLDLFAGSGAIGLEALSRGAAQVVMVEQNRTAAEHIRQHLRTLNVSGGDVENTDVFPYLTHNPNNKFDVVFLDPPYRLACLEQCCALLEQHDWLTDTAYVYLEDSGKNTLPKLPNNWELIRNKKAGEVAYYLALRQQVGS